MATQSVFISSTSIDLPEYRAAVSDAISRLGLHPIDMKHFGAGSGGAVSVSLGKVAEADFFVGIIAHRYGYVPAGMEKSVTEQEYDEAVRLKIPCLIYMVDPKYTWPPDRVEATPAAQASLASFKKRLEASEVRQFFSTPDDLGGKVAVDLAQELLRSRSRKRQRSTVMGILGVLATLVTILGIIPILSGLTELFPTLKTTPPSKMPAGFNVVVADLGELQPDETLVVSELSQQISQNIAAQMKQFLPAISGANHFLGPGDNGITAILGKTAAERAEAAQQLADLLGADIVIYGYIEASSSELVVNYIPEFHVSYEFARQQPEILAADEINEPVPFLVDEDSERTNINARLATLRLFINGVAEFTRGEAVNYRNALVLFDEAIQLSPKLSVLYILAGNTAARLGDDGSALDYYTRSITPERLHYSRGLLGRGSALFHLAIQKQPANGIYDPNRVLPEATSCLTPDIDAFELMLELAKICFDEAAASTDKPPTADIDIKVHFERAALLQWRSEHNYGDYWQPAENDLRAAIELYDQATEATKKRLYVQLGLVHGYLAQLILQTSGDAEAARREYQSAIDLLKLDANLPHAKPIIEQYATASAGLEQTLTPAP